MSECTYRFATRVKLAVDSSLVVLHQSSKLRFFLKPLVIFFFKYYFLKNLGFQE